LALQLALGDRVQFRVEVIGSEGRCSRCAHRDLPIPPGTARRQYTSDATTAGAHASVRRLS
jgi:hypothetical protein